MPIDTAISSHQPLNRVKQQTERKIMTKEIRAAYPKNDVAYPRHATKEEEIALSSKARPDSDERLLLLDTLEEKGAAEILNIYRDELPNDEGTPRRATVDAFSEAETAQFEPMIEKWTEIGLCTKPADRVMFEAGVRALHRHAKLPEPLEIIWCSSPMVACFAGSILTSFRIAANGPLDTSLYTHIDKEVVDEVQRVVLLATHIIEEAEKQEKSNAKIVDVDPSKYTTKALDAENPLVNWSNYSGGQFWAGWYDGAMSDFFINVVRVQIEQEMMLKAQALMATTRAACWWYPTDNVVFVSERPKECVVDKDNQLKALAWDLAGFTQTAESDVWRVK